MKKLTFILMVSALTVAIKSFSQNPFESLGVKDIKVLTFSNGKFNEFFDNDSIVQIGSVLFNTRSNEIVAFVEVETTYSEATLKPEITSRWLSPDPLAAKYPFISPYNYVANNPILLTDENGLEPVKKQAGTSSNFVTMLNNSPSKVGQFTGTKAENYLLRAGQTEFNWSHMRPEPIETYFNTKDSRYIYTEKGGWVDMAHFMFYAGRALEYKNAGSENPVGEAVQEGYKQEATDKWVAPQSAYSYEDLPTDKFGAEFAVKYFDPKSKLTLGEQLGNYLNNVLKATNPQNAPNYNKIPETDSKNPPSQTNETTKPLFTKDEE